MAEAGDSTQHLGQLVRGMVQVDQERDEWDALRMVEQVSS